MCSVGARSLLALTKTNLKITAPVISRFLALRSLSTSKVSFLKQIKYTEKDENLTEIEGIYVDSPRTDHVVKDVDRSSKACPLCQLDLKLQHTDVLILQQFIRRDGTLLPRYVTRLCKRQNNRVRKLVEQAQTAGLLSKPPFAHPRIMPPVVTFSEGKFNQYFVDNYFPPDE